LTKIAQEVIIAASCLILVTLTAKTETWTVTQDGSGDAPTIQAAIDSCSSGDSVQLDPGTFYIYPENIGILIDVDDIVIFGACGPDSTFIDAQHAIGGLVVIESNIKAIVKGISFINNMKVNIKYAYTHIEFDSCHYNNCQSMYVLTIEGCQNVTISNSVFINNGGGINCIDGNGEVYIQNNTFIYNGIDDEQAAVYLDSTGPYYISNNIIYDNYYGVASLSQYIHFQCNDTYNNEYNYYLLILSEPTGTNGNISLDPLFCALYPQVTSNFFLQSDSPCISGNNPQLPSCDLIGAKTVGCGNTEIDYRSWGSIKKRVRE
jgi:hypothetical protein